MEIEVVDRKQTGFAYNNRLNCFGVVKLSQHPCLSLLSSSLSIAKRMVDGSSSASAAASWVNGGSFSVHISAGQNANR